MTEATTSPYQVSLSSLFDRVEALLKQADIALSKEQFDLAEYFFQAAHSKDPENPELVFQEAQSWHRYAKTTALETYFQKAYRTYKLCFQEPQLKVKAYDAAVQLRLDEYELTKRAGALQDGLCLLDRLKKQHLAQKLSNYAFYKAQFHYQKACRDNDTEQLVDCHKKFKALAAVNPQAYTASILADNCVKLAELTQDVGYLLQAMSYRKNALDLEGRNLDYYKALALDYQRLYFATSDDNQIQSFHETCDIASIIFPENTSLYLFWAEGLIDLGIASDQISWVKLGIEKSHEALSRTGSSFECDLFLARGFSFLGKKLDRLSHIQDAFEKIKNYEENPFDQKLTLVLSEILVSFGHYFQDVDYMYQAVEKLQEALSQNSAQRRLWIEMASIYFQISLLDHNTQTIDTAAKMIDKALDFYRCPQSLLLKASIELRQGELKQQLDHFENALWYFDTAFMIHPTLFQPQPSQLFDYAKVLDYLGNYQENEELYMKSLDTLAQIMLIDPQYKELHHHIALVQFHLGELSMNPELIKKSLIHFKLALDSSDNDAIYVDWAIACLALSEMMPNQHEVIFLQHEAANKLKKALKQGQVQAYYFMACLCCVCHEADKAMDLLKIAERHEALPSPEDLMADEWLEKLRYEDEFIKLVERQEMKRPY